MSGLHHRPIRPPSGHVFRVQRKRGPAWYAKYRLPDGRQCQRRIGPAWTGRGRPPAGYHTKRTAEAWLRELLDQARRGTLPGMVRTGATFADAAAEFLRYAEHDRALKPSTLRGLPLGDPLLPAAGVRRAAPGGHHHARDRALADPARGSPETALERHQEPHPRAAPRQCSRGRVASGVFR